MGENITGVRNETPKIPYFLQNTTKRLLPLVKRFFSRLKNLLKNARNPGPKEVIDTTVVIIPNVDITAVSTAPSPSVGPSAGPTKNLIMLIKNTEICGPNSSTSTLKIAH